MTPPSPRDSECVQALKTELCPHQVYVLSCPFCKYARVEALMAQARADERSAMTAAPSPRDSEVGNDLAKGAIMCGVAPPYDMTPETGIRMWAAHITTALAQARADERERAAKVTEAKFADPRWAGHIRNAAIDIAAAIRAEAETEGDGNDV